MFGWLSSKCKGIGDAICRHAAVWYRAAEWCEDMRWCLALRGRRDECIATLSAVQEARTCLDYMAAPAELRDTQAFMPAEVTPEYLAGQAAEELAKAETLLRELADYHD